MKARPRYRMISWVAERYNVHPQTLRLWEREGLVRPTRSEGNTRLYDEDACQRLETIITLTRDLGVNLAGWRSSSTSVSRSPTSRGRTSC